MKKLLIVLSLIVFLLSCKKEEQNTKPYTPTQPTASEYDKYPVDIEYRVITTESSFTATYTTLSGFDNAGAAVFSDETKVFNVSDTAIHITTIKYPYQAYHYEIHTSSAQNNTNTIYISVDGELKCYRSNTDSLSNYLTYDY